MVFECIRTSYTNKTSCSQTGVLHCAGVHQDHKCALPLPKTKTTPPQSIRTLAKLKLGKHKSLYQLKYADFYLLNTLP